MAWVVPTLYAGVRAYNTLKQVEELDATFNSGRGKKWLKAKLQRAANRRQRMPRAFGVMAKRRRFDNAGGGDAVGVGGAYVNDIHYKRQRTLGKVNIRKLAKQGTTAIYDRWQRMGRYANTSGSLFLSRLDPVTVGMDGTTALVNASSGLPMYLWDLTSSNNYISGALSYPIPAWRALKIDSNGSIVWNGVRSENITTGALGTSYGSANWQYYDTAKASGGLESPYEAGLLDWVKIQMVVWGAKKASSKVWVEICQLDEMLQPFNDNLQALFGTALPASTIPSHTDPVEGGTKNQDLYYTNFFTRLVDSPFATYTREMRPLRYKVLDRKVLEFSPVASFEENGTALAHKKTLNFYLKMGRKCNYTWNNDIATTGSIIGNAAIETQKNQGQHDCYVHPNARVFLRVYSNTFQSTGESVFTNPEDAAPSFDIRISRKMLISE